MEARPRDWLGGVACLLITLGILTLLVINLIVVPAYGLATQEAFFTPGLFLLAWAKIGRLYGLLYLLLGFLQVVQVSRLYTYLKTQSDLIKLGTLFGLGSALLFAASGGLYFYGARAIAQAYPTHPDIALTTLHSILPAASGISVPADITISLWSILIGVAAWRGRLLPTPLAGLGIFIGVANIVAQLSGSVPVALVAFMLSPVWSLWLASLFLRPQRTSTQP